MPHMKAFGLFNKMKQRNGHLKKRSFSTSANSQYFFVKISWIGSWVSRIDQGQLQEWMEHSTLIFENLKPVEISKNIFNII
jgi:hypothetical protein